MIALVTVGSITCVDLGGLAALDQGGRPVDLTRVSPRREQARPEAMS
jgi:hypothetical protein